MKITKTIFLFFIFIPLFLYPAEYLGQDIDGTEYDCTAYSYDTGNYYYVTVVFWGGEATITFDHGGYITITLDDEEIEDPSSIDAYDYERGVYWELDVDGLD